MDTEVIELESDHSDQEQLDDDVDKFDDKFDGPEIIITSVSSLKCSICPSRQFKTSSNLDLHMEKVHKKSQLQCRTCHKILSSRRGLKNHLKTHSKTRKRFSCSICGHPFSTKRQSFDCARNHLSLAEIEEGEIFHLKCYFCQKVFFRRYDFTQHVVQHTKEKPYFCPTCPKSYTSSNNLKSHQILAHDFPKKREDITSNWKYPCPGCDKKFRTPSCLAIHLPRHSSQKNFTCPSCDKSFKFRPELVAHKKIHDDDCPYVCRQCGHRSTSNWKLKKHQLTHSNKRPFSCDLCNATFKELSSLDKHKKIVHESKDIKPWSCKTCGKCFKEKHGLNIHSKLHNLENSEWVCQTCGKKFADKRRLENHTRLHSGARDHVCGYPGCGRSFTEISNLKRHQRVVHEKVRKHCEECGQEFTNGRGLRYHLYASHKIGKPIHNQTRKWGDLSE